MTKFVSIIAVVWLCASAGCRSAARTQAVAGGDVTARQVEAVAAVADAVNRPESSVIPVGNIVQGDSQLLSAATDAALTSPPLTLSDLEGIAMAKNPTLFAAAARVNAASGKELQAGLYPNPVAGYNATEIGNFGTAGQQGGFVSQRFITAGKLHLDQAMAGKETEEASFRLQEKRQRVLSDVRVRFYDALTAQRRVDLTRELAGIGDSLVQATETLIAGGQVTENDLLQAQIRADEAHILLDNASNEQIEAWRRLAAVTGVPNMQVRPLAGELDSDSSPLDWETCYAMVLDNHPELCAARKRVERAAIAIRRAKREPIPDVEVMVSVRQNNISRDDVVNVLAGVPIPIFDRNQGNIRAAQSQWVSARNEVKHIELDLQDRLAVAYRRYANARQQTERYRLRMVPKAKRSLELVRNGYEQGQVEYLVLLTAQQTFLQVTLSYLDSLQELRAASSILAGQLLTDSLAARP